MTNIAEQYYEYFTINSYNFYLLQKLKVRNIYKNQKCSNFVNVCTITIDIVFFLNFIIKPKKYNTGILISSFDSSLKI